MVGEEVYGEGQSSELGVFSAKKCVNTYNNINKKIIKIFSEKAENSNKEI